MLEVTLMKYELEELVPIVGKLAEKYTANESTSMTYEKAEQLMGAVLYCIQELEQFRQDSIISSEGMPAQRAYEIGAAYVEEKAKKALSLYNEILGEFSHYENYCLHDTFVNGLPEFFKWYDIRFNPQNTILTLDYPVLKNISVYTGIDKIYEFIMCIFLEQKFLNLFPEDYVINILSKYNKQYKEMVENICEIVFMSVIVHILAGKPLTELDLEESDYSRIQEVFAQTDLNDINEWLKSAIKVFVEKHCENGSELLEYLSGAVSGITIRLKHAADNRALQRVL